MSTKIRCCLCEIGLDKTATGLNKKILGRKVKKFFCLECLGEHLDTTVEELLAMTEDFKIQGCKLFS